MAVSAAAARFCEPGWYRTDTGLIERTSIWLPTRKDIAGNSREIQFLVTAQLRSRAYSNCSQGPARIFLTLGRMRRDLALVGCC